jgi:putative hemin-binding periplasmic protein hmuT
VTNAAAELGLGAYDNGTREDLIRMNPDVIIIPSASYTSDGYKPASADQLYSDPVLQGVKAIANHRVFLVDSAQIMSYSQFMTRAMVSMTQYIYSM